MYDPINDPDWLCQICKFWGRTISRKENINAIKCPECARLTWPNSSINCPVGMACTFSSNQAMMLLMAKQIFGNQKQKQCKNIPDLPILVFLQDGLNAIIEKTGQAVSGYNRGIDEPKSILHGFPAWTYDRDAYAKGRLVLTKMEMLIRRKLVSGCSCGCIGSFQITVAGKRELEFFQCPPIMRNEIIEMFGVDYGKLINDQIDEQVQRFMSGKDIPHQHWSWFKFADDVINNWSSLA